MEAYRDRGKLATLTSGWNKYATPGYSYSSTVCVQVWQHTQQAVELIEVYVY